MAKHRLINCEFVNAGSFKVNVSNRAKLLYFSMFAAADDKGFVDTTNDIINALEQNDANFDNKVSLELIESSFKSALTELIDRGYLFEFKDKHLNKIHLIRHWFLHNKWKDHLWTNYFNFLNQVKIENGEYVMKPLKEVKVKENNINQDNINEYKEVDITKTEETDKKQPKSIEDFTEEELAEMSQDEVRNLLPI